MRSTTQMILLASLTLALPGCSVFAPSRPVVAAANAPCVDLVPSTWKDGVEGAPAPEPAPPMPAKPGPNATDVEKGEYWRQMFEIALGEQKKWAGFGVAESQRREDANGRTRDSIQIVGDCERRDAAAVKSATKRGVF